MMKLFLLIFFIPLLLSAQKPKNEEVKLFQLLEMLNTDAEDLSALKDSLVNYCVSNIYDDSTETECKVSKTLCKGFATDMLFVRYYKNNNREIFIEVNHGLLGLRKEKKDKKELEKLHLDFQILTDFCNTNFSLEKEDSRVGGESGHQHTKIYKTKSNFHLWIKRTTATV